MNRQYVIKSEDQHNYQFGNFYCAVNKQVSTHLKSMAIDTHQFEFSFVYGDRASGKTHLLKSLINASDTPHALYLDVDDNYDLVSLISDDTRLLALDNIDKTKDANQLLFVYERLKQLNSKLVFSASAPIKLIGFKLNDLNSRLASGAIYHLAPLEDEDKVAALKLRADLRGFNLTEEVVQYVMSRYPRDLKTLFGLLDYIDDATLRHHKRKVTIPFIKQLEIEQKFKSV